MRTFWAGLQRYYYPTGNCFHLECIINHATYDNEIINCDCMHYMQRNKQFKGGWTFDRRMDITKESEHFKEWHEIQLDTWQRMTDIASERMNYGLMSNICHTETGSRLKVSSSATDNRHSKDSRIFHRRWTWHDTQYKTRWTITDITSEWSRV